MAIFQYWNANHFRNPVSISRQELMKISKICAKATYHKCIKDLHTFGYIQYIPSYNPFKGSLVYLFDLQSSAKPLLTSNHTDIETSIEQAIAPYLNNTKILNENIENSASSLNDIVVKVTKNKAVVIEANGKPVSQKPTKKEIKNTGAEIPIPVKRFSNGDKLFPNRLDNLKIPPELEKVKEYFQQNKSTETEAIKFYNYFQSNGWKVGGKAPMRDWQAAARNWLLNAPQFSTGTKNSHLPQPPEIKTDTTKNYSEPL